MSIVQATCVSFKKEVLLALHDFANDQFKIALYTKDADLGVATELYSADDEVSGAGYTPGGFDLTVSQVFTDFDTALATFVDLVTGNITVDQISGGLIYNSSKGDTAVCALDFGRTLAKNDAPLTITFPPADRNTGLIRIQ